MEKEMKMIVNDTGAPLRKSKKKYAEEAHTHSARHGQQKVKNNNNKKKDLTMRYG